MDHTGESSRSNDTMIAADQSVRSRKFFSDHILKRDQQADHYPTARNIVYSYKRDSAHPMRICGTLPREFDYSRFGFTCYSDKNFHHSPIRGFNPSTQQGFGVTSREVKLPKTEFRFSPMVTYAPRELGNCSKELGHFSRDRVCRCRRQLNIIPAGGGQGMFQGFCC